MKWYKRDPDAFVVGTVSLTDEQFRLYSILIELWYSREDEPGEHIAASFLPWNIQRFRRVRSELIALGKLRQVGEKFIPNRVESELLSAKLRIEKMSRLGKVSAEKRKLFNDLASTYPLNADGRDNHNQNIFTSSFLLTAARVSENKQPGSLASALPTGALARPADSRANGSKSSGESLAEIVKRKGWTNE